ncbi:MAG: copper-containing nitrite reductase [Bacteroidota bacterium]|nr:copper-containing nitrite reductase [Bacteroidota bacterium]MDP4232439.1 copper-containing nitrite reductase [Bacteroidota bacterium]MDP4241575.1 copper-containing nitrite reductase [Bacteroidota bacterium]MDP4286319.1 copper-containing nitrite reductase [Bacteroidota bacterium]
MLTRIQYYTVAIIVLLLASCTGKKSGLPELTGGQREAQLTDAPLVPKRVESKGPQKVIVHLEIREVVKQISDGTAYTFWTFGGNVPGKFIRVMQDDLVEFHLSNHPGNKLPHNIDLHAVNGPGGGAEASLTAPGHTSVFSFRALNPGLYVYHCATAPVGMHIANGMYGMIFVESREHPLPPVDHEFYMMQGEIYTTGKFGDAGLQAFSMQNAIDEKPTYVVFNGSVGSTLGPKALNVKVGETVRLFVGNAGPNLSSSFHVIGEIFDNVYPEGGSEIINHNVQTTVIPPGGAAIVEFKVNVPGVYHMVDHAIFRAFNQGALADINVTGRDDSSIYSHKQRDEVYMLEGGNIQSLETSPPVEMKERPMAERMQIGEQIFTTNCAACHQLTGQGLPGVFPPLAGSDFLKNRPDKGVNIVMHGLQEPITVRGMQFNGVMPIWSFNEDQVASVLTYVRNSWGNNFGPVSLSEVRKLKK